MRRHAHPASAGAQEPPHDDAGEQAQREAGQVDAEHGQHQGVTNAPALPATAGSPGVRRRPAGCRRARARRAGPAPAASAAEGLPEGPAGRRAWRRWSPRSPSGRAGGAGHRRSRGRQAGSRTCRAPVPVVMVRMRGRAVARDRHLEAARRALRPGWTRPPRTAPDVHAKVTPSSCSGGYQSRAVGRDVQHGRRAPACRRRSTRPPVRAPSHGLGPCGEHVRPRAAREPVGQRLRRAR